MLRSRNFNASIGFHRNSSATNTKYADTDILVECCYIQIKRVHFPKQMTDLKQAYDPELYKICLVYIQKFRWNDAISFGGLVTNINISRPMLA